MSRYRKIEVRTWSDKKFLSLSPMQPSGQALWFFLLTGPHTGPVPGLFRAGAAAMAEELGWSVEAFREAFREVSSQGMAEADFEARLVWLPNAIRHNKPASPNVVRSWRDEIAMLPECDLKTRAVEAIREYLAELGTPYLSAFCDTSEHSPNGSAAPLNKASAKPSEKPSAKTMPNQEQEQEKEKEPNGSVAEGDRRILPGCPHDEIVRIYHDTLPMLPRVRLMTEARKKAMRAFWRWVLTSKKSDGTPRASTRDQALTWIHDYFERATHNDFLMGRGYRSDRHANWQCDIDFLMTERGKRHVIEKTQEVEA